jgi:translation initiation factor 1
MNCKKDRNSGIVYSTEFGTMCPKCGQARNMCACSQKATRSAGDGIVRVSRETKGRKGKGVTLIRGLALSLEELKKLAQELKNQCGCGGTVKEGVIEIQGDHRERLIETLKAKGWTVKQAGG